MLGNLTCGNDAGFPHGDAVGCSQNWCLLAWLVAAMSVAEIIGKKSIRFDRTQFAY